MSTNKRNKLTKLLADLKPGTVCLASWLESKGISRDLQQRYKKSGWLEPVGRGAFIRPGDTVGWEGALYALQEQAALPVHAGGRTALTLQGYAHFIRMRGDKLFLYAPAKTRLPKWFQDQDWSEKLSFHSTDFLPEKTGLRDHECHNFHIRISAPERAILECLYLAPAKIGVVECYYLMEGLLTLRPKLVQALLEDCASIKVKRLFLYMAEKAGLPCLKRVDRQNIDLGTGHRRITAGGTGVYVDSYQITVPRELVEL